MRTMSQRTNGRRLLALLAVAGLLAAACGNDDESTAGGTTTTAEPDGSGDGGDVDADLGEFQPLEGVPGVTDDEIAFAVMGTGAANPLGYCLLECYRAGVQAYFDYRNDLGGVHGRNLVISRVADDEFGNTQVTLLELIEDNSIFGIMAAPFLYNGYAEVGRTDVPFYSTLPSSPDGDGHENIYAPVGTICISCPTPVTTYAAQLVGATTVAALGFGISQASKDCATGTRDNIELFGPGAGVEFGYLNDELQFGFPNGVGPEVTAMGNAGVDYISTCIDQNSVLTLLQELQRQGQDDVIVSLPQGYGDHQYLTDNADLLEGHLLSVPYRPAEADVPEGSLMAAMVERLGELGQVNDYAIQGWIGADLAVTGLLAAGPQFDRAAVIEATNQITDYTAGGLLPPVDWTTAHTAPTPDEPHRVCSAFLRVRGGQLELEGDPAEPLFCWEMPLDGWTEPDTMG